MQDEHEQLKYLVKMIDSLINYYIYLHEKNLLKIRKYEIRVDRKWFDKAVLISCIDYVNINQGNKESCKMENIEKVLLNNFLCSVGEVENEAYIKCCYKTEMNITTFYIECCWIYQRFQMEEMREWFITYHIAVLYFEYSDEDVQNAEMDRAYRMIFGRLLPADQQDLSMSKDEIEKMCEMVEQKARRLRKKYSAVIYPISRTRADTENYCGNIHDVFRKNAMNWLGGAPQPKF